MGRRCSENRLTQFLGWMARRRLEIAAVFQQLGEPLINLRLRQVAERFLRFRLKLSARLADPCREQRDELLGEQHDRRFFDVEILRNESVAYIANADQVSGKHRIVSLTRKRSSIIDTPGAAGGVHW